MSHSFTYLGIRVPNTVSKLFTENFPCLVERVEQVMLLESILQHPKSLGEKSLHNFKFYYWASNIRLILHWLYEDPGADALSCIAIEFASCLSSSLAALVYAPLFFPCDKCTKNPLVRSTLKIWKQMRRHFGWQTMSPKYPIHSNHVLNPSGN